MEDREARLRTALAVLREKRLLGRSLKPAEEEALFSLDAVERCEDDARRAFGAYYLALGDGPAGGDPPELPADVALRMARWADARRRWELASDALLEKGTGKGRSGPRTVWVTPESIRLPVAAPAHGALTALFSSARWQPDPGGAGISATTSGGAVHLEADGEGDAAVGAALREVARHGASAAQTFLALAALWRETMGDAPHETYMTVYASDLLRYQGRKATPRGGFHKEDLLAKGRDVWLLGRVRLPVTRVRTDADGSVRTESQLGRLISLESLESVTTSPAGGEPAESLLRFRFHLGGEVARWLGGDNARSVAAGGALLTYHPTRQKYQILLGLALAHAAAEAGEVDIEIPLLDLLGRAGLRFPDVRMLAFLTMIEDAVAELARDRVVADLRIVKPAGWPDLMAERRTRDIVDGTTVRFRRPLGAITS